MSENTDNKHIKKNPIDKLKGPIREKASENVDKLIKALEEAAEMLSYVARHPGHGEFMDTARAKLALSYMKTINVKLNGPNNNGGGVINLVEHYAEFVRPNQSVANRKQETDDEVSQSQELDMNHLNDMITDDTDYDRL